MALDLLRRAIDDNTRIIDKLNAAHRRCDPDGVAAAVGDLFLNNADLMLALEELVAHPPTTSDDGSAPEGAGPTTAQR